MIKVGVVGATGYTGLELLRLIQGHKDVQLDIVTSRSEHGRSVTDLFPWLSGQPDLRYSKPDDEALCKCDLVFFATPNATAMYQVPALLQAGVKIIDLSADFRLKDPDVWRTWYGQAHACPELLDEAVYGLPEVNREVIKGANIVANPGCYPTAIQLGFLPLLEKKLIDPDSLIADAKSGISGAGRKESMTTQFCETADSFKAYAVPGHRHLPEIKQGLESVYKGALTLTFVPHLTPIIRGIHATLYAKLTSTSVDLQKIYADRYQDELFVDVMPEGSHPDTRSVRGANICRIACHRPQNGNTVVILVVEDNLVKGAAGQAIQNMNIMFGLPEANGLTAPILAP